MSLKTNADKIKAGYIDACNAILARGGYVPNGMPIGDLDEAIKGIPRDQVLAYYKQVNSEQVITVPQNTEPYARIGKIGGMTYKSENLIPTPTRGWTSNGITFTVQNDGSIVANGTATGEATYELIKNGLADNIKLVKGKTYTFSGCPANGSNTTYRMVMQHTGYSQNFDDFGSGVTKVTSYEDYYVFIRIYAGYTADNLVFKPMLNEGTVAKPYSQFFNGLRNAAVSEMKSDGANLLNIQAEISLPSNTSSINTTPRFFTPNTIIVGLAFNNYYQPSQVSIVERTENSIRFSNASGYGLGFAFELKPNTYYTVSCETDISEIQTTASFYKDNGEYEANAKVYNTTLSFITNNTGKTIVSFIDKSTGMGEKKEMTIANVMLNEGKTAQPYKPYRGKIDTLPIPQEVQALDGCGGGLATGDNYIEFGSKKYIQNFKNTVLTGNENWKQSTTASGITIYYCVIKGLEPKASRKEYQINSHFGYGDYENGLSVHAGGVCRAYVLNRFSTLEEWIAFLKEQYANNTPVEIAIVIAEPIETDISAYLADEFVKVESGGTLTAVNEHNYDMPTEINYIINTVGG